MYHECKLKEWPVVLCGEGATIEGCSRSISDESPMYISFHRDRSAKHEINYTTSAQEVPFSERSIFATMLFCKTMITMNKLQAHKSTQQYLQLLHILKKQPL